MRAVISICFATALLATVNWCTAETPATENAVPNGSFDQWENYQGGVTTTSVGVPGGSIAKDWQGGPGVDATATYDRIAFDKGQTAVPGDPHYFLRVEWTKGPETWAGEAHHQPDFRYTFLEYFGMGDVAAFAGKTLKVSFYARVSEGELDLIPILWQSRDAETPGIVAVKGKGYELFEAAGKPGEVAVAQGRPRPEAICRINTTWQRFEKTITLPTTEDLSITAGNYTGFGFDRIDRAAVAIDIAEIVVTDISN